MIPLIVMDTKRRSAVTNLLPRSVFNHSASLQNHALLAAEEKETHSFRTPSITPTTIVCCQESSQFPCMTSFSSLEANWCHTVGFLLHSLRDSLHKPSQLKDYENLQEITRGVFLIQKKVSA